MQETFENFSYDWLKFSSHVKLELPTEISNDIQYFMKNNGNGLLHWYTLTGGKSDLIVNYDLAIRFKDTISRLDIAYDVLLDDTTIEYIFDKERNTSIKYIRYERNVDSTTGRTIYFGKGDFLLRIYEKGKQLRLDRTHPELKNWIRFEFQLKGRRARNSNFTFNNPQEDFKMLAEKYIKAELLEMLAEQYYTVFKPIKGDTYAYLNNNVIPYLRSRLSDPVVVAEVKKLLKEIEQSN